MPPQNNPYEFINAPGQVPPTSPLGGLAGDNSMKKRIIVVAGGLVGLIIVAVIATSIISNIGKGNTLVLINVAVDQSELNDVATQAAQMAFGQAAKNLSATVVATSASDEYQYTKLLSGQGIRLSSAQKNKKDTSADAQLTTANTDGTYDSTFVQIVQALLNTYKNDLSAAYKASASVSRKKMLSGFYSEATLIQTLANQAAQN